MKSSWTRRSVVGGFLSLPMLSAATSALAEPGISKDKITIGAYLPLQSGLFGWCYAASGRSGRFFQIRERRRWHLQPQD